MPSRIWIDSADTGFWGWDRCGDVVLMSAELEFAAWDTHARKLWSMFVEPPWSYAVNKGKVILNVMGEVYLRCWCRTKCMIVNKSLRVRRKAAAVYLGQPKAASPVPLYAAFDRRGTLSLTIWFANRPPVNPGIMGSPRTEKAI